MKFRYLAYDAKGASTTGVVDAPDPNEAGNRLRRDGLFPTSITKVADDKEDNAGSGAKAGARLRNLALVARQLSVLVGNGTPLVQALRAVESQMKDQRWRRILTDVRKRVEEGSSLNEAMSEFPACFDSVTRSLVAAGESAGNLERMLQRLSVLLRKQLKTRNTLVGAMVYPVLLIVVAVGVLAVMILGVLPRFSGLFDTFDMALPPSTAVLMETSAVLRQWWWAFLAGIVPVVVSVVLMFRTARGRRVRDTILLRAPRIGALTKSFAIARICRMLGVLLDSKVPLLDALELTRDSASNIHYRDLLVHAEEVVSKGESLSNALGSKGLVNPAVIEAIRNGEESGQLGPVLVDLADFLDEDNEVIVKSATSILEPLILIVLGLVVAFIALSMFLPLFDLTSMAGGQ